MLMATRLSKRDATWLGIDDSTTAAHIVSLIIVEPSDQLSHDRLHQLVKSSLPQLARFRSRLVSKPLGVGQPMWAEIDHYDPTSQIHRATIPAPGGPREFAELIAQLGTEAHERRKSLWEAWSIDGLEGGRWAVAVKMSPALDDGGVGTTSVWSRLLRSGPRDYPASDRSSQPSLGPSPSLAELLADTMTELVENYVKGLWLFADAVTGVLQAAHDQLRGTSEPHRIPPAVSSMSGPLPHNVFDAPLTERRAVAFASIPIADLQTVSKAFGGNIANVFMAACTLSLRAWLQRHDTVPDNPLLMQIPGAVPTTFGPFAAERIRIPVQLDDPVEVLTNLHTATERLKAGHIGNAENAEATGDLTRIASLIPQSLVRAGMRLYGGLGRRQKLRSICHGSVSYVNGPPVPAYCAGAKVVGMHTVAPLPECCGLKITVSPRDKVMDLSVCVCPDNVTAVDDIATGITESVDVLLAAARKSPRGQGRSVVTEMTSHNPKRWHARGY
jgi:diacylglycerol O-acyltransferase